MDLKKNKTKIATIRKRVFAFLIDILLLNIIIITPFRDIFIALVPKEPFTFTLTIESLYALQAVTNYILIFAFFYFVLLEFTLGQTVGKLLMNLKVKGIKKKPTFMQCMLRSLFLFPLFPSIIFTIDIVYMFFFSKTRQRLTENLSKTIIVEK
jgi:uncharacterized RDD family membrane protein YckC